MFQPRSSGRAPCGTDSALGDVVPFDRGRVLVAALEAMVVGDVSRFAEWFTDDVALRAPHVMAHSLGSLLREVGSPEESLTDVQIIVLSLDSVDDKLIVEWRLEAMFSGPVLFADRFLIEPTGSRVSLQGASVAEFVGRRIRALRHYFDDSELFDAVPGTSSQLRWRMDG